MNDLWTLFFTMQIMIYMRIYDVAFPLNSELYILEFKKIIEFDLLNPAGIIRIWNPEFTWMGLITGLKTQTKSMVDDLSILIFVGVVIVVLGLVVWVLLFAKHRYRDKIDKLVQTLKKMIFFNMIIRSVTISFLLFAMGASNQIKMFLQKVPNQPSQDFIIGFIILGVLFLMPLVSLKVLSKYRWRLHEIRIKEKIQNLYSDIHLYRNPTNIYYYPIFMFRRVIFVLIPTFLWFMAFLEI